MIRELLILGAVSIGLLLFTVQVAYTGQMARMNYDTAQITKPVRVYRNRIVRIPGCDLWDTIRYACEGEL